MKINFKHDLLYKYLLSFDLFRNKEEGRGYLADAYWRFIKTIELIPNSVAKGEMLELGANPYFLTLILKKYYKLKPRLSNYFGENFKGKSGEQIITSNKYGEVHKFKFKHFNIEKDPFPYENNSFDFVINCEILEHLTIDPVKSFQEIHRILKKGGRLLITTPNVNRRENWFKLIRGENIYDPYSGYGAYGRHNREYTINELRDILFVNGFKIEKAGSFFKKPISNQPKERALRFAVKRILKNKDQGDHLYVLAVKKCNKKPTRPSYLYRSL